VNELIIWNTHRWSSTVASLGFDSISLLLDTWISRYYCALTMRKRLWEGRAKVSAPTNGSLWFPRLPARRRQLQHWPPFSPPDIGSPLQRWWRRHVGCYARHAGCYAVTGSAAGGCQDLAQKWSPTSVTIGSVLGFRAICLTSVPPLGRDIGWYE
jgi:hypothetical protein